MNATSIAIQPLNDEDVDWDAATIEKRANVQMLPCAAALPFLGAPPMSLYAAQMASAVCTSKCNSTSSWVGRSGCVVKVASVSSEMTVGHSYKISASESAS